MENIQQFALIVFAFIGVVVTLVVTIIALVWLTCFMVRLLVRTFSYRVDVSVDVAKEDIDNKAKAKKQRNKLKRDSRNQHKMTILKMKLENEQKIFELRKDSLAKSLLQKENKERIKLGMPTVELEEVETMEDTTDIKDTTAKVNKDTKKDDVVEENANEKESDTAK